MLSDRAHYGLQTATCQVIILLGGVWGSAAPEKNEMFLLKLRILVYSE